MWQSLYSVYKGGEVMRAYIHKCMHCMGTVPRELAQTTYYMWKHLLINLQTLEKSTSARAQTARSHAKEFPKEKA